MMRPPPPPIRCVDPAPKTFQPPHPSLSKPLPSESYRPSLPFYAANYRSTNKPHSSHIRLPIISPCPRASSRPPSYPFRSLVSTQPTSESAGQEPEEDEADNLSHPSSLPEAQPLHRPSFPQTYGQRPAQSRAQSTNILVQESTHVPGGPHRPPATVDLLGGFSPPSSVLQPSAQQRIQSDSVIPETRPESQSQSQEDRKTRPPRRVDTYRPGPGTTPTEARRPVNIWQVGMEGVPVRGLRPASTIVQPASSMEVVRHQSSGSSGVGAKGAQELYMASAQQQGRGGSRTASEKIMDALSDWSLQILETLAEVRNDQKKLRDQVHDVQTSQRALATREEVMEEITAQLSPALHEFFETLHVKIDSSIQPLPEETAKLAADKMRAIAMEIEQLKASQRSQDDSQEKTISKLLDHVISKLDAASHISDFLHGCKDLPEALRDMAIYKQSMDTLTDMVRTNPPTAPTPIAVPIPHARDASILQGLLEAMDQLNRHFHQHMAKCSAAGEDTRILNAINVLAKGLDRLPICQPRLSAPAQPQAVPITQPPHLPHDILLLREKVDAMQTDVRDIKAILTHHNSNPPRPPSFAPPPQPNLDIASVVAQLKTALPSIIAQIQPFAPGAVATPAARLTFHPPQVTPLASEDHSQLQPDGASNSQSQTACDYPPTPRTNWEDCSYNSSRAFAQPYQEVGPSGREGGLIRSADYLAGSASAHSTLDCGAGTAPVPISGTTPSANGSIQSKMNFIPRAATVQPPLADVFGQIQTTSLTSMHNAGFRPAPLFGPGGLAVEVLGEETEFVDCYDDIFNQEPRQGPSKPNFPPKGRGKRAASNTASSSSAPKRSRTRAAATPIDSLPVVRAPAPKSRKKIPGIPSDANHLSSGNSAEDPIVTPPTSREAEPILLSPSSIPGRGVLKRSPRIIAVRTESTDPMYNSDLDTSFSIANKAKRSCQSKAIKQELIDVPEVAEVLGSGLGSVSQPISLEDSESPTAFFNLSKRVSPDSKSLALRSSPRLRKETSPGRGDMVGPSETAGHGEGGRQQMDPGPEASLSCTPKDPAPMARSATYGRRNRAANISYGGDDSDADDAL